MAIQRTTFSESWYKLAELKPLLLPSLKIWRQSYRGELWFVIEDSVNNQFFRVTYPAYQFLALLDGKKTIDEVWNLCMEKFEDEAPTQGEILQLLGQLYSSNLLIGDIPIDSQGLLVRYKQRIQKEVIGKLKSFMFVKIPLCDPDDFLRALMPLGSWIVSKFGFILWLIIISFGGFICAGIYSELLQDSSGVISPSNLPLLYLGFATSKVLHELGHAFVCRKLGIDNGTGGEVHKLGIMFMLLTPIPFVDCSSSWSFKSKWHRMIVGASGMMMDLIIGTVCLFIWSQTAEGNLFHALAYNIIFVTTVSTLLFNGNPLMRYDAYFMLSDFIEVPNLASRGNTYFLYLCRKYILGVREAECPTVDLKERLWLFFYSIGAFIYRLFIMTGITMFIANSLFILGVLFGISIIWGMAIKPLWKYFKYLAFSHELRYCRKRAYSITLTAIIALFSVLLLIDVPDRVRIEGIVEPVEMKIVYSLYHGTLLNSKTEGFCKKGDILAKFKNEDLLNGKKTMQDDIELKRIELKQAKKEDPAKAQVIVKELEILLKNIVLLNKNIKALKVEAPISGLWTVERIDKRYGEYMQQGVEIGKISKLDNMIIRAVANQEKAQLITDNVSNVEMRIKGRPKQFFKGKFIRKISVGLEDLPSAALGLVGGGDIQIKQSEQSGRKVTEKVFEIHIKPNKKVMKDLIPGQVVVVRCELKEKPLGIQLWRFLKQQFQKRFRVL